MKDSNNSGEGLMKRLVQPDSYLCSCQYPWGPTQAPRCPWSFLTCPYIGKHILSLLLISLSLSLLGAAKRKKRKLTAVATPLLVSRKIPGIQVNIH